VSRQTATAPSASPRAIRAAMLWGVIVGLLQAATPLALWWLDSATVYALGLILIATVFVVVAPAAVTGSPWLLVAGLAKLGGLDALVSRAFRG
jgi:type III secretory pathway component EscS